VQNTTFSLETVIDARIMVSIVINGVDGIVSNIWLTLKLLKLTCTSTITNGYTGKNVVVAL